MFGENAMTKLVEFCQLNGDLTDLFGFLGSQFLAMPLGITELPEVMEAGPDGVHDRKDTRTPTRIRQTMRMEVFVLQTKPVARDEASQEIQPADVCLGAAQGLVANGKQVERKFSVKNDRIDTLNEDVLENGIRLDRIHSAPDLDDKL